MKLKVVLEKGPDGYIIAYCPSCKGCVTQGRTEEDAVANLKDSVELWPELFGTQNFICQDHRADF